MYANPGTIQTIVIKTRRQGWLINPGKALISGSRSCLLLVSVILVLGGRAAAQGPTVDTTVPVLPGAGESLLGRAPGSGGGTFSNLPGAGGIFGGRPGVSTPKGIPTSISNPGSGPGPTELQMPISSPQPAPVSPTTTPFYGTLEIPDAENDNGPPGGLTLDQAIDITLERSLDLRSKFIEIPMARADVLQASLRANPVFYQDGQLLQYGGTTTKFSRMAPGGPSQFDTNVSYPFDISHKRQARTMVAARAERVLEALYQDAIRQRIDDVYGAYVMALAARQTVIYAKKSVAGLDEHRALSEQRYEKKAISLGELNAVKIKQKNAQLGLVDSEAAYRKAKLDLGSFMNLTHEEIAALELRGMIDDLAPPPRSDSPGGFPETRRGGAASGRGLFAARHPAGGSGRSTCSGKCLQRCVCFMATVYFSGQLSIRLEEPVLVGAGCHCPAASLQPQPGRNPARQVKCDPVADSAFGSGTSGQDRRCTGDSGVRGHAARGKGSPRAGPSRCDAGA